MGESSARRRTALLKKEPVIRDGSQSREDPQLGRTPKVSRFAAALCVTMHTQRGKLSPMADQSIDKREQYVAFATQCLQLPKVAGDNQSRTVLREMAAEWLKLAEVTSESNGGS
jgi:hypothetical protein